MALLIGFTAAASNTQGSPWYLDLLLWVTILAWIGFLVTGGIYLGRLFWGKKLEIDVGESESNSKVSNQGNKHVFEVPYALKAQRPPVDIARVTLYLQCTKLKATEPPFKLDNTIQSHVSTFELSDDIQPWRPLRIEDKYRLSILALGREWESCEFQMPHISVTIEVPTAHAYVEALPVEIKIDSTPQDSSDAKTKNS